MQKKFNCRINNSYSFKKIKILNTIKKINQKFEQKEITSLNSQNFYFATTAEYYGLLRILRLSNEPIAISFYITIIKNILGGIFFSNSEIIKKKYTINYSNIIITWARRANFKNDGSLDDKYFNINSKKTKRTLWIVIYLDKDLPTNIKKKINNNILIYRNIPKKYNFFNYVKFLYQKIFNIKDAELLMHNLSNYSYFSYNFFEMIKKYLTKDLKYLYLLYEAQPFQNNIIYNLKKNKFKTKIIGYIHAVPLSLPANYIFRKYSPDKIIVNGKDQFECFTKHLYWPKELVKVRPSMRFLRNKKNDMCNKIFLPLCIRNHNQILIQMYNLINKYNFEIFNFVIQKHPLSLNSKEMANFEKKLNKILDQSIKTKKIKNTDKISIFIGSSGAIIEALERGIKVIQVCENPSIETYSNKLFKNILMKKIDSNIFSYKLKNKGKIVMLGNSKNHQTFIKKF